MAVKQKCASCGNYHEILCYSPRCHPGAPMFLSLFVEDQTLTATCARCGEVAGAWQIKEVQIQEVTTVN